MKMGKRFIVFICLVKISLSANAQEESLSNNYVGFIPSVLVEPYDTINAVEINFFPFLYEFRFGYSKDLGFQVRPIVNYRFQKGQNGFSQIGSTLLVVKYFLNVFEDVFWLKPQLGMYYTYAYNRLDEIQTMTLGVEPGVLIKISKNYSLSVNLQPGINYYPDTFSKSFVDTESGFKPHFGVIFHIGYNF